MKQKTIFSLTLISALFGFMLVLQIKTTHQPEVKETRDVWKLRENYLAAREMEANLLAEIRKADETIARYEQERLHSKEQAFIETLNELKQEAGLTELTGPGLAITLEPLPQEMYPGLDNPYLSATILRKMVNELNMYGAQAISIAGKRVVQSTVIREIQGATRIDGFPLRNYPVEIKVLAATLQDAEKIYNSLQISSLRDDFFVDRINMKIGEPEVEVTIPPYDGTIKIDVMESSDEGASE